ncbi:MAG TPA: MFS transporter [Patescibacteria group bacterium]
MLLKHFPSFTYRDFRLLWISELISAIGTGIFKVAIGWQLYALTHSPFALGLMGLVQLIPFLASNLIGGAAADSHNRKRILYITQPVIALGSFFLGLTTFLHIISPVLIYIILALVSVALAFDMPTRGAFLPTLVERKDLVNANSIYTLLWEIADIIGPGIGGFLLASIGIASIYFLDFVSTLFVVGAIALMHNNGEPEKERSLFSLQSIRHSFTFLFSKHILWTTKLLDAASVLFASCVILFPVYAKDILHVGPQGLGLMYTAPAMGAFIVGVVYSKISTKFSRQGAILLGAVAVYALSTILFGISKIFFISFLALFISGGANVVSVIIRATITQLNTPGNMMGRVSAISSFFWVSGDRLGDLEGGVVAQFLGAPFAVAFGGIVALGIVGSMAIFNPLLRNYVYKDEV